MRTTVEIVTASQASLRTDMNDIEVQLNNLEARLDESIVELDQAASLVNAVVLYIYIAAPG